MIQIDTQDKKLFSLLVTPSWLSGLIAVSAGLIVSVGVIIAFSVNISSVQQQLTVWQQNQPTRELTKPSQIVTSNDHPQIKDSWPLLVVWAGVGLLVYIITAAIVHGLSSAEALRESMGYVNSKPLVALEITAGHIVLRIVATIALIALVRIFIKEIIPYGITAAHASASDLLSATGLLYAVLAFAIIVVTIHIQTIFLRLALGRVRVFSAGV